MILDCRLRDALRRELEDPVYLSLDKAGYIHTDNRPSVRSCGNTPSYTTWNKALGRAWSRTRRSLRRIIISATGPVVVEKRDERGDTGYPSRFQNSAVENHRNCIPYNITLQFLARELGELNRAIDYRLNKG